MYRELGKPAYVNIAYDENCIYIGGDIPNCTSEYELKCTNKSSERSKRVIYCGVLISEMINVMKIKLSSKGCGTIYDAKYHTFEEKVIGQFDFSSRKRSNK